MNYFFMNYDYFGWIYFRYPFIYLIQCANFKPTIPITIKDAESNLQMDAESPK